MDAILAEIALKKQQLKQASSSSAKGAANGSSSKYIKRGELEAQRQREYHKKEEERLRLRKQQQLQKSNSSSSSEVNSSSNLDLSSSSVAAAKDVDTNTSSTTTTTTPNLLSNADIIKRFRSRQQPIRLFGETDAERMVRLAQLESSELAANDESGGGQTNEWRSAVKDTDMEKTLELLYKNKDNSSSSSSSPNRNNNNNSSSSALDDDEDANNNEDMDTTEISLALLQSNPTRNRQLITAYLRRVLRSWERALKRRDDALRDTPHGKLEAAKQKQCTVSLEPFFKNLRKNRIADDVLARITEICEFMQQREYQMANDSYLRLSIGNAAWPIGVTMVGIHERSGRERIFESKTGHVLNDETQRKWIQSIKRLMTFAQTAWPPEDLSKLVG